MKTFADFIVKNKRYIIVIMVILLIPTLIGMKMTKINYDILVYLPEDIATVEGQNILTDDFDMGAFSVTILDGMNAKSITELERKLKQVDGVNRVITAYDALGDTIPIEILPSEIRNKISKNNSNLMLITYKDSTSSEETLKAVDEVKKITKDKCKIGGMSALVLDTMNLSNKEILIYIVIAVLLCLLVLELVLNSYLIAPLLLLNIGIAILFNMGTNIFLGEISYITKALVAVLQLGVTTDFSIFLIHSYENKKNKYASKDEAMSEAIRETFSSVLGSSLTTVAGFLVLCTMKLTLGRDLGIVMAKGVIIGVISVLTIFPSMILIADKWIEKTKHKPLLPSFSKVSEFIVKYRYVFLALFLILILPMYIANTKTSIYYKLDESLPDNLDSIIANTELKEKFNIASPEIILIDKNLKTEKINEMISEIESLDGIDFIISTSKLDNMGLTSEMLPKEISNSLESDKYKMILLNSTYDIATNELNEQTENIEKIIAKYDEHAILAGEGPLMKDLVKISDEDFRSVNIWSIGCILIIMLFVLKSISLPIILIIAIENAIFINMGIPYFTNTTLPFIASIVLGTIQLGATIDYAILLTNTYLRKRKNNEEKCNAMVSTLNSCISSILVSGLCFFAATFGVGIYSDLEMISSLCTLISRGAVISMFVVITVLPSLLLVFDKLITKTTLGFKKEGKKMNNEFKKVLFWSITILIYLSVTPVNALTKDETVYAHLDSTGKITSKTVNEHLINSNQSETLQDESELKDILNISGDETYTQENGKISWYANGNDIQYTGSTNKSLPITMSIKYYLNGKEKSLDEILGKSGKVNIVINYKNSDVHYTRINGKNEMLYTPFVVTSGMIFDDNVTNLVIDNGKIIDNGAKKIVVALSSPGLYESLGINKLKLDTVSITFDVEEFYLPTIYTVAIPKLLSSDDLNIFNELDNLYSKKDTLANSVTELNSGINTLKNGTNEINDGATKIYESVLLSLDSIKNLKDASRGVDNGLKEILEAISQNKTLLNDSNNDASIAQIQSLIATNRASANSIKQNNPTLESTYVNFGLQNLTQEQIATFTKETYSSFGIVLTDEDVPTYNANLITTKSTYELTELLEGNSKALESLLDSVGTLKASTNVMIQTLEEKLTLLESYTSLIADGTDNLSTSMNTLSDKLSELANGTKQIDDGMNELSTKISDYSIKGLDMLNGYVSKIQTLESKTKNVVKLGEMYGTFDSKDSNYNGNTKFIYIIDGVKQNNTETEEKKVIEKTTFWTRIKNLFK